MCMTSNMRLPFAAVVETLHFINFVKCADVAVDLSFRRKSGVIEKMLSIKRDLWW